MKLTLSALLFALSLGLATSSHALDGQGTISEVQICGSGLSTWRSYVMYKLSDGNWFAVNGNYAGGTKSDYDDTPSLSLIMLAFANGWPVQVRATHSIDTMCGQTVAKTWNIVNDYIKVVRP